MPRDSHAPLLSVEHLSVVIDGAGGGRTGTARPLVDEVSVTIGRGETLGLVGESGSGKSLTASAILRLVQPPLRIASGRVIFEGRDLLALSERDMQAVRGRGIGLVFQEPGVALNPVFSVGDQLSETLRAHGSLSRSAARSKARSLLDAVKVADADRRLDEYPHQLSGGLRQRVMIALALAGSPSLLIADEPTTALDVTIQAQILDLLRELRAALSLSLLLITHDFGVLASMADRVAVMQSGRIVEQAPVEQIFREPSHPYTRDLLASVSQLDATAGGAR